MNLPDPRTASTGVTAARADSRAGVGARITSLGLTSIPEAFKSAANWMARMLSPPCEKKSSSGPTVVPSTVPKASAMRRTVSVRSATAVGPLWAGSTFGPSAARAASSLRSTLPVVDLGRSSTRWIRAGTNAEANREAAVARSASGSFETRNATSSRSPVGARWGTTAASATPAMARSAASTSRISTRWPRILICWSRRPT